MNDQEVKYYDGLTSKPQTAELWLIHDKIDLLDTDTKELLKSFHLSDASVSSTGDQVYLYSDASKRAHVVVSPGHPDYITIQNAMHDNNRGWFHRLLRVRGAALLVLLIALFSLVYFVFVNLVPFVGTHIISTKKEIALGEEMAGQVLQDYKINEEATLKAQAFADHMQLSKNYPIKVTVVDDNIINAFAVPGGRIVVFSGILKEMKSYREMAALLGHETSHINDRHTLRSILRGLSSTLLVSLVTGDGSGFSATIARNAAQLNGLSYSRSLEQEADEDGMKLMLANHVDAQGMILLLEHLKDAAGDIPESVSFLSNHPLTSERLRFAREYATQHALAAEDEHIDLKEQWTSLKKSVETVDEKVELTPPGDN
jgi:beta-barrel assembly-enhancing protease